MISEMKEDFNWEFVFLAANEEASLTAEGMGISKGNSYSFANNDRGLKDAYSAVSYSASVFRTSNVTSMDGLMDDYREIGK